MDAEVDANVRVARHSPAMIASHTVALGNGGVGEVKEEHEEKKDAEVSYPRNSPLGREAPSFGMQLTPAAFANEIMHTAGAVPTHNQAENGKENDETENEASKSVIWCLLVVARRSSASR